MTTNDCVNWSSGRKAVQVETAGNATTVEEEFMQLEKTWIEKGRSADGYNTHRGICFMRIGAFSLQELTECLFLWGSMRMMSKIDRMLGPKLAVMSY
jgi:hypothetical protein